MNAKNHFHIYLHREHRNDYCNLVALQAAEINAESYTMDAKHLHHIIERSIKENGIVGVEATLDDVGNRIFIDVLGNDGRYNTGLTLQQVELTEMANPTQEEV